MVKTDVEKLVRSELDGRLVKHGLESLRYDVVNWEEALYFFFPKEGCESFEKALIAIASEMDKSIGSLLRLKKGSVEYEREEDYIDDDEDFDGDDEEAVSPEIAALQAKIAALPKFPIDVIDKRTFAGEPHIIVEACKADCVETEEEKSWEAVANEQEKLEDMIAEIEEREDRLEQEEYERTHPFTLLPIPPPPKTRNTEVYLTMAYEPYDDIEKGEKTTEFREYNEYYVKKLLSQPIKTIRFQRGYGGPGHDAPRQMRWSVKNIEYYNINTGKSAPLNNVPEGFRPTHIAIDLDARVD